MTCKLEFKVRDVFIWGGRGFCFGFPRDPSEFINSNGPDVYGWDGMFSGSTPDDGQRGGALTVTVAYANSERVICRSNESLYRPQVDRSSSIGTAGWKWP